MAYASSNHLAAIEDYVPDVLKAKQLGYKGYKIHPGAGQHRDGPPIPTYMGHMEMIREIRKAVGDEFVLMHDPVQRYSRFEALTVGRLLDELDYLWFEDPIRTIDQEGLIELGQKLNLPLHVGEFLYSIADYAEYIKRDALGAVRLISDNVGAISGSMLSLIHIYVDVIQLLFAVEPQRIVEDSGSHCRIGAIAKGIQRRTGRRAIDGCI